MFNRGEDHARHRGVHTEHCLARDHVGKIEQGIAFLPDIAPLRPRLQLEFVRFRNRQLCGRSGQLAVAQFAVAGSMHHKVQLGRAVARGHFPLRGGSADQHGASGAADLTHQVKRTADGVRPICILIAIFRVADRLINLDLGPIGVELIGDYQRQGSAAPASHLRAVRDDGYGAVCCNRHPQAGIECGWSSRFIFGVQ